MAEQVTPTVEPEPEQESRVRWRDDDGTIENFEKAFEQKPELAYFKCPFCEYSAERERTVRTHIRREDDDNHHNKDGFLDEFVHGYDENDEHVADIEPPGSLQPTDFENISDDFLPTGVSDPDSRKAEILKWAIADPTLSEKEIAERVYEGDTEPSYIYRVLDDHLRSDSPAAEKTPGQEDTKAWDDLTEKQQTFIAEYVHDDSRPMATIEDEAGVSGGYGQRTLDKYENVVEDVREKAESGDINLDEYRNIDESEAEEEAEEEPEKSWGDLTENQQAVIDAHIKNPDKPKIHIDDEVGMSQGYTSRTLSENEALVEARREELGEVEEEEEAAEEETTVSWESEEEVEEEAPTPEDVATNEQVAELSQQISKLEESVSERIDAVSKRVDEVEAGLNDRIDAVEEGSAQGGIPSAEVTERDGVELDDEAWAVVVRTLAQNLDEDNDDVLMEVISQV